MTTAATGDVGRLLRSWRQRRRLSQLELASRAEVSSRHLSFVETGRAQPSSEMIVRLADQLEVPLRERNSLLLAGGYAPQYAAAEPADLAPVLASFRQLLDAHAPYPALLLDRYWDLIDSNAPVSGLLEGVAPHLLEPPVNVIRLSLHPDGLAPRIGNLAQWRAHLLHQLDARAERTGDPRLAQLHDEVAAYPVPTTGGERSAPVSPVIPLVLLPLGAGPALRFFSVASVVEAPSDVTIDELHLETFLPADQETAEILRA
ncbi:helix-turn-helix transcriptional regulator [Calidifontibacter sp. DB0510]|uniref:Helix-turn-helix transcriptional regulator n=1 Tax=Metallococcus carri TaxID=1656884 RepID=A0A967B7N4_9MICO|nr:helix-turn-helix transcriptional regulator [Metallococcus carri]NHN57087.1 helix-turn-helix transcriptional regulator [Metallococcus carri]NOP39044.1 helix-turn-helix transcriptional regulator [Calidifontibacter sp. DB2511S]